MNRMLSELTVEVSRALSRLVTGKLLTEGQVRGLTASVIGRHFSDWFPEPEEEKAARLRVDAARNHIAEATRIIMGLKSDLDAQTSQLDDLTKQINEKRQIAERYAAMAAVHREATAALRSEIEETLRRELIAQASQGKRLRQVASFLLWLVTLLLGGGVGFYFGEIVKWAGAFLT